MENSGTDSIVSRGTRNILGLVTLAAAEDLVEEIGEEMLHPRDGIVCSRAFCLRRAMLGVRSILESEVMMLVEHKKSSSIVQRKPTGGSRLFISLEKTRVMNPIETEV